MSPYYEPHILPDVFMAKGIVYAKWVVVCGGLAGLSASLVGAIYPLPRVLYSMSVDGLVFKFFSNVNKRTKVPIMGTLCSGLLAGLISAVFNLKELADMMSIGTLLAYTLVAVSVTILRYRKDTSDAPITKNCSSSHLSDEDLLDEEKLGFYSLYSFHNLLNRDEATVPTTKTSYIGNRLVLIATACIILLNAAINFQLDRLLIGDWVAYAITMFVLSFVLFFLYCLSRQPMNRNNENFEVPFVPVIPMVSVWVNILLMFNLSGLTWIRFAIWMTIGNYPNDTFDVFCSQHGNHRCTLPAVNIRT